MATIKDLPYELLNYIIFLLVQSSGGAENFAKIISVKFLLFAEDENILKLVNFDIKMEFKNFYRYQHVSSLLVKCSEAGNVAAQFLLGKVILVSSSQLLLGEWQKVERGLHPCDFTTLSDLCCIIATKVPAQNHKVGVFMTKFFPEQVSTSEFSETRLVHYQLVKLFLLKCSPHDLIEMVVFLRCYFFYFTKYCYSDLFFFIKKLVIQARRIRANEPLAKSKELFIDAYMGLRDFLKSPGASRKYFDENILEAGFLFKLLRFRCHKVGVFWHEAIHDVDLPEELWRNDMSNQFDKEYSEFNKIRAETLDLFEHDLYKFGHVIHEL